MLVFDMPEFREYFTFDKMLMIKTLIPGLIGKVNYSMFIKIMSIYFIYDYDRMPKRTIQEQLKS